MSRIGPIVALTVTALLAIGAIVFLRGGGPSKPPGPLLVFEPSRVTELRIESTERGGVVVTRDASGEWMLAPEGKPDQAWPAAAVQVRAALRLLAALPSISGSSESGGPEQDHRATVRLKFDDSRVLGLRVGTRALAGSVAAESIDATGAVVSRGRVDSQIASMLKDVETWRDAAALPSLGADVSRITLQGASGTIGLARVQGKWSLREPVVEAANPEAVTKLVGVLAGLRVEGFLDGKDSGAEDMVREPQARATIESDERDADGLLATTRRVLSVGRAKNLSNSSLYAKIEGVSRTPRFVTIASAGLASLSTDPSGYISRQAIAAPLAEIGRVSISRAGQVARVFQRTLDGWTMADGANAARAIPESDAMLGGMLKIIGTASAERITIQAPTKNAREEGTLATIELATVAGTPIGALRIEARADEKDSTGKAAWIVLVSPNGVERWYPASSFAEFANALRRE